MIEGITIPAKWSWAKFGDVARIASDLVDPTLTPDAIHIAPNHIESKTGKLLPFTTVSSDKVTSPKHRFHSGQILYSKIRPYLAKAVQISFDGLCSADMYPVDALIDSKFLFHWLLSPWFTAKTSQNQGRTILPKINQVALCRLPVPVPPLHEQQRIAAKIEELFSDLDAGVAALKRAKANLKRYRAAVLKAAVEGKLTEEWRAKHPAKEPASALLARILKERRQKWESDQLAKFTATGKEPPKNWKEKYVEPTPPDTTGLPTIPNSWTWTTLDALANIVGGITKDQKKANQPGMREVPYLRVANVQRGFLDLSEMKSISASETDIAELRLEEGDVLFTEGGDRDKLGRGWVWSNDLTECIHQNHIFRGRLVFRDMQSRFVSHHSNTFGREWFTKAGKQTTNLASINLAILRRFPVPVPPVEEQAEIITLVDERLSLIDAAEKEIEHSLLRAARLRQSILKQAFEGKLVPQDPKDEPANVLLERIKGGTSAKIASTNGTPRTRTRRRSSTKNHAED